MNFEGKVAVVTGAARGIGRAIALRLASAGAAVAVNFRSNVGAAEQVVRQVQDAGGRAFAFAGDVGLPAEAQGRSRGSRARRPAQAPAVGTTGGWTLGALFCSRQVWRSALIFSRNATSMALSGTALGSRR